MDNNLLVDITADEYASDYQRGSIQPRWNIYIQIHDRVTAALSESAAHCDFRTCDALNDFSQLAMW